MDVKNDILQKKTSSEVKSKSVYTRKVKGRFNGVDAVILLFVLAFIAFAVYVMLSGGSTVSHFLSSLFNKGSEDVSISYTVLIENCDGDTASTVKVGNRVYVGDLLVGVIAEAPVTEPHLVVDGEYTIDESTGEKQLVMSRYGDRVDLRIVITADADLIKNVGVTVNGVRIASGAEYDLRSSGFSATGKCISLVTTRN